MAPPGWMSGPEQAVATPRAGPSGTPVDRRRGRQRPEKRLTLLIPGLQNLAERNEQLYGSGNAPSGGVALPFILVQTRPHATVEVEISEDMQLVHFDFNSTPFELHDDSFVLKALGFSGKEPNGTKAQVANGGQWGKRLVV
ncbi:hypothetical protein GUJ93_ZPchr0010g10309 [Zizania palustris]|uniref:Transcription factor DP C-terminal domain-containing protein n=1 Tax=Zizania palustris TaxID=103762 RepID=A0A8J5WFH8_ZIZPA|nr:hypothetical protein GUJ93_ZPchr0010g10309 [Zizania palustris]